MTNKLKILCFIFLLIASYCLFNSFLKWRKITIGNKIVQEIELYKTLHGNYPKNFYDIGMEPDEVFGGMATNRFGTMYCYEQTTDSYLLWYGTSIGEGMYYHPETMKWDIIP